MLEELGTMAAYKDGETVFDQGDTGHEMYIVRSGSVRIFRVLSGKETVLAVLGDNDFFGEMALFGDVPRSASARAVGDTQLQLIDKDSFQSLLKEPVAWMVMSKTAERIREVDKKLEELSVQDQIRKDQISSLTVRSRWFE